MGESSDTLFSSQVIDEWAGLGIDLPALFSAGDLGTRMGLSIQEASPERVVGTLPVAGNTQPYGLLHGGASAVLAETLGSVGAMLHGGPNKIAMGVDLNCTHHRPVRTGTITGIATPAHAGRTSASYEVVITDDRGKRVCTARLTCALRPAAQQNSAPAESAQGQAQGRAESQAESQANGRADGGADGAGEGRADAGEPGGTAG